jgi:ABC-2 type transport system permease protein
MNTQTNAMNDSPLGSQGIAPAVLPATRSMYWSIRRELWENRSLYVGPLAVAGVSLFGFLIGLFVLPRHFRAALALDPAKQRAAIAIPYDIAAGLIMVTALIVSFFYCLDALYGERRDRSILFWKSLPVSDLTAVLSKASIPLILQLIGWAVTVAMYVIMLLLSSVVLAGASLSVATLWTNVSLLQRSFGLLYHLITVHMMWYAPIYAWLLLVSAWARRVPILWAILPPFAIAFVERIAFNTSHFASWVLYRFSGPEQATSLVPGSGMDAMTPFDPGHFLSAPGLWLGLVFAAACLGGAVLLRRNRGPM